MNEEAVIPWVTSRARVPPLTAVRSTILGTSVASLRTHGLADRYLSLLAPEYADAILTTQAGVWLPVATAEAHYFACDGLGLAKHEILEIGRDVAKATRAKVFTTALRLSKQAGATPWTLLAHCGSFWAHMFQGSGIAVFKLGPKDARFEVTSCSLVRSSYWRAGLRGLLETATGPFATKIYVEELPALHTDTACGFRIAWV